jgi:NADPH:quinone reductase-like Zn-dependent oxidoreductase
MQALVHDRYGPPDVLELREIDIPRPEEGEVLIRVYAASVNPYDWHLLTGTPLVARVLTGIRRPKSRILGRDVAGRIEAVGPNVTRFQPGDDVFGAGEGSFAEYARASEDTLVHMPASLTYARAACLPVAGVSALQALRDKGRLQPGQTVLINGAAGGVGTFAVQIAAAMGAHVTGVCSTTNVELVHSLGAECVIDYSREDFTAGGKRYDLIVDNVSNHGFRALRRAMNPAGRCLIVGGAKHKRLLGPLGPMLRSMLVTKFVSQAFMPFIGAMKPDDLRALCDLVESGTVTPVIETTYTLADVPSALRQIEGGHTRGKLAVVIHDPSDRER